MDLDWNSSPKEINGIDLTNYVPKKRSYNSVEYIHKKYFEPLQPIVENTHREKVKTRKPYKSQQDKTQQFNCDKHEIKDAYTIITNNDASVLEQTIKFAKNIVPLVIPPNENKSQVFYTIKTAKKRKTKDKKVQESNFEHHIPTHEREERPKKIIETYKRVKKESISIKESISHSDNTLDDLNMNQSLCCTFSEMSEKKHHKKDKSLKSVKKAANKFAVSESFEAVATEAATGDGKIKIHLMNDREKHFLSDSIKEPVLNALKECLSEFNNYNLNTDITTVQKIVKCNSEKLDYILDKLTCIENKLDNHEKKLDIQGRKFDVYEKKLVAQEVKLESQESKLNSHKNMLDSQEMMLDSHVKRLENYEKEFNTYMSRSVASGDQKISQPKVQVNKLEAKASTLENLGEDLIEIDQDYSSEEELHQELLDRRCKSKVVELGDDYKEYKKMENLGGGEVPHSVKGTSSMGTKLERPNRIPARFCWTDAARKN